MNYFVNSLSQIYESLSMTQNNYNIDSFYVLNDNDLLELEHITHDSNLILYDELYLNKDLKIRVIRSINSFRRYYNTNIDEINTIIQEILNNISGNYLSRDQINTAIVLNKFMKDELKEPLDYDSDVESEIDPFDTL